MKRNLYPTVTIVLSFTIGIFYFLYLDYKVPDKKWDAATNFLTTVLSIIVGAMISIVIYNFQKASENKQRLNELTKNLESELSDKTGSV